MDSFKLSVVLLQQHDYDYWLTGHSVLIVFTDGKSASMSVVSWSPWPTVASSVYRPGIYSPARLERTVPGRLASHFGTKKPCTTYRCVNSQHNRTYCASIQSYIHSKKRVWFIIFIFPWNCMNISSRRQQACLWSIAAKRLFQSSSPQLLPALLFCVVLGGRWSRNGSGIPNSREKPKARSRSPPFTNSILTFQNMLRFQTIRKGKTGKRHTFPWEALSMGICIPEHIQSTRFSRTCVDRKEGRKSTPTAGVSGFYVRPSAGKWLYSLWSHRHRHDLCSMPRMSVFSPDILQKLLKTGPSQHHGFPPQSPGGVPFHDRLRAIAAGYRGLERKFSRAHRLALKDGHLIMLNITTSCNKFRHLNIHLITYILTY